MLPGPETLETLGLTQRELILEMRADIKELTRTQAKSPSRGEVYGVMAAVSTIAIALVNVVL